MIFLFIPFFALAQEGYRHSVYTTEDGLPSCFVHSVFQDSRDFLWVCTDAGLSRYDGRKFVNYSPSDGLLGSAVFFVKEDAWGNLWINTSQGLSRFNGKKFEKINFDLPDINDVLIDGDSVWIGTKKGLFIYDIRRAITTRDTDFPGTKITSIIKTKDGSILIGTNSGIIKYKSGFTVFWKPDNPEYVMGMAEDLSGFIWFGTLSGKIFCHKADTFLSMQTRDVYEKRMVDSMKASTQMEHGDLTGSIIITRDNEVVFVRTKSFSFFKNVTFEKTLTGLLDDKNNFMLKALQDREGNFWLASYNGLGALRTDYIKKYRFSHEESVEGIFKLSNDTNIYTSDGHFVYKIAGDTFVKAFTNMPNFEGPLLFFTKTADSTYLFGSQFDDLFAYKNGEFKDLSKIANGFIFSVKNVGENTWIGSNGKVLVYKHDSMRTIDRKNQDGININGFSVLPLNEKDEMLIGSQFGLYKCKNGVYTHLAMPFIDQYVPIHSIYDCKDGTYLLSTYGYGLLRVKIHDSSLVVVNSLTKKNGLGTDFIETTLVDGNTIWLIGKNGVYKVANYFENPTVEYINTDEGMLKNSWEHSFLCMDSEGYIYVGGSAGLAKFDKNTLFSSRLVSRAYITDVTVNNSEFYWNVPDSSLTFTGVPSGYIFSHKQNSLVFFYTGINMSRPSRIKYQYQLEGYQTTPITSSEDHVVFNNLPHGDYKFKVRATANQSFTNEPYTVFSFTIKSPFWLTWWFRIAMLFSLLLCAYLFYRWRLGEHTRKQRRELQVAKQLNESKILAFQARMNPHFIFNSLAAIQYFITKNDNLSTLKYLSKFARLLRQILDNTRETKITLDNEISMLNSYVEIEELRFENRFGYEIVVADNLANTNMEIPGMIIQPFVENAILHGLLHKPERGWLKISFETNGKQVICTVEDNGIGRRQSGQLNEKKAAKHRSHGSSIAIDTLQLLNDSEKGINNEVLFIDKEENGVSVGTKVIIKIPIV